MTPAAAMSPTPTVRLGTPPERISVAHHSGPGLRLIFWVQGCSLLCTRRCLNPHLLSHRGGYPLSVPQLTGHLLAMAAEYCQVEGVTVLGGEPFDQAGALAGALAPVRQAGLSIMVYTGNTLEALRQAPPPGATSLLALCDLLVDGPFLEAQHDPALIWRGSANQRILRLSDRYSAEDLERAIAAQGRGAFVSRTAAGDAVASGAQTTAAARQLRGLAVELAAAMPGGQP